MKSIGKVIQETRTKKKLSRERLEELTKIKKEFIENLEAERWESLPEYPVFRGFVKNISSALTLGEKRMTALLRRDYPPKALSVNPKPDVVEKFSWSPRLTFLVGVFSVTLFILGYLIFQYINFIRPPNLLVSQPQDGQAVDTVALNVVGKTDPDAIVLVNNQPTVVEEDGTFMAEIDIFEGTEEITIISRSRSGKETVIRRKIKPELSSE